MTAAEVSTRNFAFFQSYAKKEVEMKCYECPKFTYYGKTCNGACVKESVISRPEIVEGSPLLRDSEVTRT